MKGKFSISQFEADFYTMLYKNYSLDVSEFNRKLFWNGYTLRVVMRKGVIVQIDDIRGRNAVTVYSKVFQGVTA